VDDAGLRRRHAEEPRRATRARPPGATAWARARARAPPSSTRHPRVPAWKGRHAPSARRSSSRPGTMSSATRRPHQATVERRPVGTSRPRRRESRLTMRAGGGVEHRRGWCRWSNSAGREGGGTSGGRPYSRRVKRAAHCASNRLTASGRRSACSRAPTAPPRRPPRESRWPGPPERMRQPQRRQHPARRREVRHRKKTRPPVSVIRRRRRSRRTTRRGSGRTRRWPPRSRPHPSDGNEHVADDVDERADPA